ncbi:emp24 gp25L p24 family [Cryptosporidium sp. chipmunk genotype I]|uniref:emp24 gp25L p24 family n=1 Tax=Cryptosporidium sp. chipmunk genotype I TaxID=1280935 RepID=UPI00351A6B50|nr:emp24 gp25L p24 family [Cryptosporidium sp. chipmunk genotype I]
MNKSSLPFLVLLLMTCLKYTKCMDFKLKLSPQEIKCLSESILKSTLITLSVVASEQVNIQIIDDSHILFESKEKNPKAAFTTIKTGIHRFCFINTSQEDNWASIALKWGPGAYDSGSIANKADFEPIDAAIMNINIALKEYQANIKQMKSLANNIQNATSKASNRIAALSIFNIASIILINVIQTLYIKKFFKSRKLI